MRDRSFLSWPFFDETHRDLARHFEEWCASHASLLEAEDEDVDGRFRGLVGELGKASWLKHCVPAPYGGAGSELNVRTLCIMRETLGYRSGLADFAFAMQGLGAGPITFFGSDALKRKYLPRVAAGEAIAAFAISESDAGSDVAAMSTTATRDGSGFTFSGEKTWISNAGIADFYVVFCRFPEGGEKSYIALVVDADNPGMKVSKRIEVIAPHPLGTLTFNNCKVAQDSLVGEVGKGLRVALGTLDVFRTTVGAAALGFARRALDEAVTFAKSRKVSGGTLSETQLTQAKIAEMALAIDASALLVYRAAWQRDAGAERITREAAMAKLHATESAQRVIDEAVQVLGARGVVSGATVERLYRDIRSLRIYEGTSEIQKLIIAGQVLNG